MLGYYENDEANKESFTEDGWFRTGDYAKIDKDGYIYISGRKKFVIVLQNGKNVYPEEIETLINNLPDGLNINENAGSTHIDNLVEIVKRDKYDIGIAYDGDADRCILVDELGNIVDGDFIIAICGNQLKKEDKLRNNALVGTIMSNLGLVKYCEANNINFEATKVGDKYVLENMLNNDYILGGEQSGHIIFKEYANTGDGELTSLQILDAMIKENKNFKLGNCPETETIKGSRGGCYEENNEYTRNFRLRYVSRSCRGSSRTRICRKI